MTHSSDTGQRLKLRENATTTLFVTPIYNLSYSGPINIPGFTSTTIKHIFANGTLVATVEKPTSTAVIRYTLTDHLGGVNVIVNTTSTGQETLDYYPYGGARVDVKASGYGGEKRKYIGQEHDTGANLEYLNARYYDSNRGQFASQDPVFWELKQNLSDPQSLNSYSYANGNPIVNKDPTGRATYIGDNGRIIVGKDTWNPNTYYQYQDSALLNANAALGESNRWNAPLFASQVLPGGPMDYKRNPEHRGFYFFNGKLVTAEEFGNLNYGYTGAAFGFGKDILTDAAGVIQITTAGKDNRGPTLTNFSGNFDARFDTQNIRYGASSYNNSKRPNSSKLYGSASTVIYDATTISSMVKTLSAIAAVLTQIYLKLSK